MKLVVTTPDRVMLEAEGVTAIRAEDPSGGFGILPGHCDLLTVLMPSVIIWRTASAPERYIAVRGGVLTVRGGTEVAVATREAFSGDDLDALEAELVRSVETARESEQEAHAEVARLQVAVVRNIERYLNATRKARTAMGERR